LHEREDLIEASAIRGDRERVGARGAAGGSPQREREEERA
jgi:hypothetical protein